MGKSLMCLEIKTESKSEDPRKWKSCQRELIPEVSCIGEMQIKALCKKQSLVFQKTGFIAHCSVVISQIHKSNAYSKVCSSCSKYKGRCRTQKEHLT